MCLKCIIAHHKKSLLHHFHIRVNKQSLMDQCDRKRIVKKGETAQHVKVLLKIFAILLIELMFLELQICSETSNENV